MAYCISAYIEGSMNIPQEFVDANPLAAAVAMSEKYPTAPVTIWTEARGRARLLGGKVVEDYPDFAEYYLVDTTSKEDLVHCIVFAEMLPWEEWMSYGDAVLPETWASLSVEALLARYKAAIAKSLL